MFGDVEIVDDSLLWGLAWPVFNTNWRQAAAWLP